MKSVVALLALGGAVASPVDKVVELIKELQSKLQADEIAEQKVYDKYACWCEKTSDRKAGAIEQAKEDIQRLGNEVLSLKGKVATLTSEIAQLTRDIKQNEKDQADATTLRMKENGDFMQEKAEMEQTINALERAITVLSGAGTKTSLLGVRSRLNSAFKKANVAVEQQQLVRAFLESGSGYAPQSETVQGILKDMYSTFATNLENDTTDEMKKQKNFEKKISILQEELAVLSKTLAKKQSQKADAEQTLAATTQNLDDTTNQMNDDAEFFDLTAKQCKAKSDQFSERKRLRTEELDGIAKALEILTSDEAREMFNKSIKAGFEFTQLSQAPLSRAFRVLERTASKSHSIRLAALAAKMKKSGHFDAVMKAIDQMIQDLKDEELKDAEERDTCKDKTHKKTERRDELNHFIMRNEAKIERLTNKIEKLTKHIADTAEAIQQTKDDIKELKNNRDEEHANFQQAKSDDEAAVALLTDAIGHLSAFYENNNIDAGKLEENRFFIQEPEFEVSEDQAPEAQFKDKGARKGESKGIISILTMLNEDLKNEIKNGVAADIEAQKVFEENLAAAEKLLANLREKKTNLEGEKTDTENKKEAEENLMADNEGMRDNKNEELATIKPGCDWILNNFEKRRDFRRSEKEGLEQAKSILAGAQAGLLEKKARMQKRQLFNDDVLPSLSFSGATSFLQKN